MNPHLLLAPAHPIELMKQQTDQAARVIVADPPWSFEDKLPGEGRGAEKHYTTLPVNEIMRFPLPPISTTGALLCLWRVAAMQQEALDVIRAWGFTLKSEIVWHKKTKSGDKTAFGMGHYVRGAHEVCLLATRGRFHVKDKAIRSIFETHVIEASIGEHSAKPDEFFALIERLAGEGPLVELFARKPRPAWHTFGNEIPDGYAFTRGDIRVATDKTDKPAAESNGVTVASKTQSGNSPADKHSGEPAVDAHSESQDSEIVQEVAEAIAIESAADQASQGNSTSGRDGEHDSNITSHDTEHDGRINGIRTLGHLAAALAKAGAPVGIAELAAWTPDEREAADVFLTQGGTPAPARVEDAMRRACDACAKGQPVGVGASHTNKGPFCLPGLEKRATANGEPFQGPDPSPSLASTAPAETTKKKGRTRKEKDPVVAEPEKGKAAPDPLQPLSGWDAARGRAAGGQDPVFEAGFYS